MNIINRVCLYCVIVVVGCNEAGNKYAGDIQTEHKFIDSIQLKDLQGRRTNLNEFKGKTIFINFWATWCKPCIAEMPSIAKAQSRLTNKNVVFLMASNETANEIETFKRSGGYDFKYVRIENGEEIGIQALPTTFIFDSEGNLIFSEAGMRDWNEESNLNLILKNTK